MNSRFTMFVLVVCLGSLSVSNSILSKDSSVKDSKQGTSNYKRKFIKDGVFGYKWGTPMMDMDASLFREPENRDELWKYAYLPPLGYGSTVNKFGDAKVKISFQSFEGRLNSVSIWSETQDRDKLKAAVMILYGEPTGEMRDWSITSFGTCDFYEWNEAKTLRFLLFKCDDPNTLWTFEMKSTKYSKEEMSQIVEKRLELEKESKLKKGNGIGKGPLKESIDELSRHFISSGVNVTKITGEELSNSSAHITIVWPGFNKYSLSARKDVLHAIINIPIAKYKSVGSVITIRNVIRQVAKVTSSEWSGITTEFY